MKCYGCQCCGMCPQSGPIVSIVLVVRPLEYYSGVGWEILGGGGAMGFKIEIVWLEPFDLCDSWMNEGWICVSYDLINCPAKFPSNHINTVDLTVHTPTFGFCSANSETLFYDFTRWTLLLQCHIQEFFSLNIENTCNWKLVSLTIYGDNWTVTEA